MQVAHKDLDYVRIVPHGRDKYPRLFEARIRVSIHRAKLDESVSGGFRTSGMPYVLEYTFKSFSKCFVTHYEKRCHHANF